MEPILASRFWDEEKNGGKIQDVVQTFLGKRYYWFCQECGDSISLSVNDFASMMHSVLKRTSSQLNFLCQSCLFDHKYKKSQDILPEIAKLDEEEGKVFMDAYLSNPRELTFVTVCPVCGKYHAVKQRVFKRVGSFVCSECLRKYESSLDVVGKTMEELFPGIEDYWGSNKHSARETYPLLTRQPFKLICPDCGQEYEKQYYSIDRTGFYCQTCARIKSRIQNVGSLKDLYPEVARMWDEGGNDTPSDKMASSSQVEGTFLCRGKDGLEPPHTFKAKLYSVVEASKKGNNGCPVCYNRKIVSEDYPDVYGFMKRNSLKGSAKGSAYITLRDSVTEELRAVAVFRFRDDSYKQMLLVQYCEAGIVEDGLKTIIETAFSTFKSECVYALSDNSLAEEDMYTSIGFKLDASIPADYTYCIANKRVSKLDLRKGNFNLEQSIIYKEGMTETELASINNLKRCWDCGKKRMILVNEKY